jgi:hypothetical protein
LTNESSAAYLIALSVHYIPVIPIEERRASASRWYKKEWELWFRSLKKRNNSLKYRPESPENAASYVAG